MGDLHLGRSGGFKLGRPHSIHGAGGWWLAARQRLDGVAPAAILSPASGRSMLDGKPASDGALISRQGGVKYVIGKDGALQEVAANALAYEHASGRRRLRYEGQATNLCIWSGDPTNAVWGGSNIERTTGQADPMGGTAAVKVTCTASGAPSHSYQGYATFVSGTTYTLSRFVKAGTQSLLQMTGATAAFGSSQYANFNLATGAVAAAVGCVAAIVPLGSGWFRISITLAATASTAAAAGGSVAFIASAADGRFPSTRLSTYFHEAFPQCETGPTASSYIPTSGAAVTRPADVAPLWSGAGDATAWAWRGSVPGAIASQMLLGSSGGAYLGGGSTMPFANIGLEDATPVLNLGGTGIPGTIGICAGWGGSGRSGSVGGLEAGSSATLPSYARTVMAIGPVGGLVTGQILNLDELVAWQLPDRPSAAGCQAQARVWSA